MKNLQEAASSTNEEEYHVAQMKPANYPQALSDSRSGAHPLGVIHALLELAKVRLGCQGRKHLRRGDRRELVCRQYDRD